MTNSLTLTIGSAPIALVQNGAVTETIISTSGPIPITLPTASTAGTFLFAVVSSGGSAGAGVTSLPAGWTRLANPDIDPTDFEVWVYPNNPGAIVSISAQASALVSGSRWYTHLSEWSGVKSASYLDSSGTATSSAGTTLTPTTSSVVGAGSTLAIVGWMQQIGGAPAPNVFTSPAQFTRLIDTSSLSRSQHLDLEYMLTPNAGVKLAPILTSDTTTTTAAGAVIVLTAGASALDMTAFLKYD